MTITKSVRSDWTAEAFLTTNYEMSLKISVKQNKVFQLLFHSVWWRKSWSKHEMYYRIAGLSLKILTFVPTGNRNSSFLRKETGNGKEWRDPERKRVEKCIFSFPSLSGLRRKLHSEAVKIHFYRNFSLIPLPAFADPRSDQSRHFLPAKGKKPPWEAWAN